MISADRGRQVVRALFGTGIISVGILLLIRGYDVLVFEPPPPSWVAWLRPVGYASGVLLLGTGAGLLFERSARLSTGILFPFLLAWTVTRVPIVLSDPLTEISWFAVGEVGVLAAAALVLFTRSSAMSTGSWARRVAARHGLTVARLLVGYSLVTFGLSHFFQFAERTVSLVPAWLPFRRAWADLAGAAQVAAGLGAFFAVCPRLAVAAEAAMLTLFTLLAWIPAVITAPGLWSNWVEFLFTWALAGACWVVAEGIPRGPSFPS